MLIILYCLCVIGGLYIAYVIFNNSIDGSQNDAAIAVGIMSLIPFVNLLVVGIPALAFAWVYISDYIHERYLRIKLRRSRFRREVESKLETWNTIYICEECKVASRKYQRLTLPELEYSMNCPFCHKENAQLNMVLEEIDFVPFAPALTKAKVKDYLKAYQKHEAIQQKNSQKRRKINEEIQKEQAEIARKEKQMLFVDSQMEAYLALKENNFDKMYSEQLKSLKESITIENEPNH